MSDILKNLNLDSMSLAEQVKLLSSIEKALINSKVRQKELVKTNTDLVLQSLKKIRNDIEAKFNFFEQSFNDKAAKIEGRPGKDGRDGKDGAAGVNGVDGKDGKDGRDGRDGREGVDGKDGVSVVNAYIDFDNSLVIELSDGRQINAGEVLPPDLADKLKVIVNTSTGGVGLPEQTGNSGKVLTTDGANLSWTTAGGGGGSGDVTGPASSTDNAIARFDATTGKLIQNSTVTVSDTGDIAGVSSLGVANYIDFDTTPTVSNAVGRMYWDAAQNSLAVGLTSTLAADVGQTLYARATNAEAVTINKGEVVYAFGATGNRLSVKLAYNTGDATSAKTIGVAAENITAGGTGMIICQGVLNGLNLGAYTDGDSIYLGATAGSITATKPYAPNHLVYVGTVERANAGNGQLYVRIQNGYEMDELHNVSAQNPTNGQILIYNQTTSLWEKANITAGTNIAVTNGAGSITIASTGGDVTGVASSVDSEIALWSGTTGKVLKRATATGVLKATSGVLAAATAGTDYVAPGTATTFTATQTFNGTSSTLATVLTDAAEVITISATAATGTINYDITTQSVLYYTSNASANWTVNFRGSSGTSLNTLMATGQSMTVTFLVTQGTTAYYNNVVQVDGSSVTPKYQGGTAWAAGNASSIDAYTYTIVKTGSAAFTVFAAQTQFK